jgi:hypothetical protein
MRIRQGGHNFCKIAILGLHDTREQFEMIDHLVAEIEEDRSVEQVLFYLGPSDKMEVDKRKF